MVLVLNITSVFNSLGMESLVYQEHITNLRKMALKQIVMLKLLVSLPILSQVIKRLLWLRATARSVTTALLKREVKDLPMLGRLRMTKDVTSVKNVLRNRQL